MYARPQVVVVVFTMKGCPACQEYLPRFRRIAQRWASCIPVVYLDAAKDAQQDRADKFTIKYTPTTLILKRPNGFLKWESSLSDEEIEAIFQRAAYHARCEV